MRAARRVLKALVRVGLLAALVRLLRRGLGGTPSPVSWPPVPKAPGRTVGAKD